MPGGEEILTEYHAAEIFDGRISADENEPRKALIMFHRALRRRGFHGTPIRISASLSDVLVPQRHHGRSEG
jgi:hypothetical protein